MSNPTARERAHRIMKAYLACRGDQPGRFHADLCDEIADTIEAAVAAERERCEAEKTAAVEAMRERNLKIVYALRSEELEKIGPADDIQNDWADGYHLGASDAAWKIAEQIRFDTGVLE